MDFFGLILLLIVVGVILAFFPIDGTIKNIILCLVVLAVVFALFHGYSAHQYFRW